MCGLVAFLPMFAATFISPIIFERAGKEFIQGKIEEQAGKLQVRARQALGDRFPEKVAALIAEMQDLRIFSGSNAAVFMLLLGVTFLKPRAIAHLFLPGILLVLSSLISAWFYLFEQNWFFTLVGNDYVGWGYLGYMSAVFLFLADIVFNGAQATTLVVNHLLQVIGKSASLAPC